MNSIPPKPQHLLSLRESHVRITLAALEQLDDELLTDAEDEAANQMIDLLIFEVKVADAYNEYLIQEASDE